MKRRGNALIETAMFVPLLVLLLVGTAEVARVTYVYYSVQKALYAAARFAGTRQGINLCDDADPELITAKNWALTGATEGGDPIILGLSPDMVQIRMERQQPDSDIIGVCGCSVTECDTAQGGRPPDFIVASIPDGFSVPVSIPYLTTNVITFRPNVRVPFGGT